MKRKLAFVLAFVFSLIPVFLDARDKVDETGKVMEAVNARRYVVEMDWAISNSGRNVSLSPGYKLEVRNDTVVAYLPFYGRAYSLPYGDSGTIDLDTTLEEYESEVVEKKKYSQVEISFEVSDAGDRFRFFLVVAENGTANLSVTSNRRSPMNYRGNLLSLDQVENEEKERSR